MEASEGFNVAGASGSLLFGGSSSTDPPCSQPFLPFSLSATQMSGTVDCSATWWDFNAQDSFSHTAVVSGSVYLTWSTEPLFNCSAIVNDVSLTYGPAYPPSQDSPATTMVAEFNPFRGQALTGTPLTLADYAASCGYAGFDWQQKIDLYRRLARTAHELDARTRCCVFRRQSRSAFTIGCQRKGWE